LFVRLAASINETRSDEWYCDRSDEGTTMSTRNDYNADEWAAIAAAPAAASFAITTSDSVWTFESAKTQNRVCNMIPQSALEDAPEIVKVLIESRKTGRLEPPEMLRGDRAHAEEVLIRTVRLAVRAIERKSPAELEPFKAWLASLAAKFCHANTPDADEIPFRSETRNAFEQLVNILHVTFVPSDACHSPIRLRTTAEARRPRLSISRSFVR